MEPLRTRYNYCCNELRINNYLIIDSRQCKVKMRNKGLDFLRGIAIVLVLFRHTETNDMLHHIGWVGVDLFFVLSGFLVSGLIFREYINTGVVNIKRFLIRRGLKIYPSFYVFIIVSIIVEYFVNHDFYKWKIIFAEIFYLQSYFWGMWMHTWSVAVEEHFYFGLSLLAFLSLRFHKLQNTKLVLSSLFFAYLLTFLMRFYVSWQNKDETLFGIMQTHLRIDGIILGVLISYLYHFTSFNSLFIRYKFYFFGTSLLLLSPIFIYAGGSFFMNSVGISIMDIGFGIFVLFAVNLKMPEKLINYKFLKLIGNAVCFIGINSYSIYLWHLMSKKIVDHFQLEHTISIVIYFTFAIIVGVFMSFLVEKPFLRVRELYFQSK